MIYVATIIMLAALIGWALAERRVTSVVAANQVLSKRLADSDSGLSIAVESLGRCKGETADAAQRVADLTTELTALRQSERMARLRNFQLQREVDIHEAEPIPLVQQATISFLLPDDIPRQ